ncbi:MAG: SDR family oxidoreductase [Chloroflexia bacterium]|nr:SDR family oxidoreductase [Chloroflexia bacterium]
MELRLDGKVALVTGSDSGIGRGIAELFASSGADVAVNYHTDEAGAKGTAALIEAAGRRAIVVQADVGAPEQVERLFGEIDRAFARLDILVNNAGIGLSGLVHELDFADWERVLRTNLYGPFLCAQQAARRMLAHGGGGRILNITSVHEEACFAGGAAYNASKAGLRNLTRTQAAELAEHGITVNAIAPGMILTPMNGRALADAEYRAHAAAQIPLRRPGVPADIAHMALFLASDAASYCTGATYYVDGGWMLTLPEV